MNEKVVVAGTRVFLILIGVVFLGAGIFTFFDPQAMGRRWGSRH